MGVQASPRIWKVQKYRDRVLKIKHIFTMNDMVNLSEDGKTVISALDHLTRHITIPQGVEVIGNWALCSLDYLTSVVFLDDVIEIGDYAFAGDFSLLNFDIHLFAYNTSLFYNNIIHKIVFFCK